MRRAPASSAFSTSSLTTEAGRSTTSPAAIWLARWTGRRWILTSSQSAVAVVSRHRIVTHRIGVAVISRIVQRANRHSAVIKVTADSTVDRRLPTVDCHIHRRIRKNTSIPSDTAIMKNSRTHKNCRRAEAEVRQVDVHAVQAGEERQRHEDRRDDRQHLHHPVQLVRHGRQVRVEQAGDAILEEHRLVGQAARGDRRRRGSGRTTSR